MAMFAVSVGVTPTLIVPYQEKRKSLVIMNNDPVATVYISNDQANILTQGFPLPPGATYAVTLDDGDEPFLQVYGQSSAVVDIRVIEGSEQ